MNKKIFSNSLWMMSEKIVSIFGLIFVTSFVAKYVGPEIFGSIALAMSIFQLIQLVSQLGTDVLIFKRISRKISSGVLLINVTVPIRVLVYILLSFPVLIYNYTFISSAGFYYVLAAFVACFFQAMDVYAIYYDATLNSKINTIINIFGLILSLLLRWIIAFLQLDPVWLCIPIILSALIPFIIRLFFYKKRTSEFHISKRYKKKYVSYVIGAGMSLVISSLSVAIYTRLSIFLLGFFEGKSAVGIYSVAATLATSWSFILNSLITSTLPSIFSENSEDETLKKTAHLNWIIIGISVPVIIGIFIVGVWFLNYFYGKDYAQAFTPLYILSFSTVFGALGTISARIIAKYSGYAFLSKKMLLVAVFSFVMNVLLIKLYGIFGAALANALTQFFSLTFFNYPFKKGIVLKLHKKTLLFRTLFFK